MSAKKATAATREIRWVEGFKKGTQPIHWNQIKKGKVGEREISIPSDRRSNFEYPAQGKAKPKAKHSKAEQDKLQKAADAVIARIQKITDGDVTSFFYSAEQDTLRYSEVVTFDGQQITENHETDDETLLEAAQDFADLVAETVVSAGKPLGLAAGPKVEEQAEDEE